MTQFVLNIRDEEIQKPGGGVRVHRTNLRLAQKLHGRRVLLYAPTREIEAGFVGTALIADTVPDFGDANFIRIHLSGRTRLDAPAGLHELLVPHGFSPPPFYRYSKALHPIDPNHLYALTAHFGFLEGELAEKVQPDDVEPNQDIGSSRKISRYALIRARIVRFQMLDQYGPRGAFTLEFGPSPGRPAMGRRGRSFVAATIWWSRQPEQCFADEQNRQLGLG